MTRIKKIAKYIKEAIELRDIFFFSGIILMATGLREVYPPAALIIPGIIFTWLGIRKVSK